MKLLLWPTKALLRPAPRLRTWLASESPGLGMALKLVPLTGASRVSIDVSLAFVTLTSRGPEGHIKQTLMWKNQSNKFKYRSAAGQDSPSSPDAHHRTRDSGLEGTPGDVVGSSVFDADQVVPRCHGSVEHFVTFWNLLAVQLNFRRTLDGHGQRSGSGFSVVDDELRLDACENQTPLMQDLCQRVYGKSVLSGDSPVVPLSSPAP